MTTLPPAYAWLAREPGPAMLREALALYGTAEKVGTANNPVILGWARELGLGQIYTADATPWCGLFVAVAAKRGSWSPVKNPLWARNWATWGTHVAEPSLGDVLVFSREGGAGHVGLYVGEDGGAYHVLGGNQGDRVSIVRVAKGRLIAARRAAWRVVQPANVRPIRLAAGGALSTDEA